MRGPHEGHTKATGKTYDFSAYGRQGVRILQAYCNIRLVNPFLHKRLRFTSGLRVAFACFISGRCVADAWPLRKAENAHRNDFLLVAARGRQNSFYRLSCDKYAVGRAYSCYRQSFL